MCWNFLFMAELEEAPHSLSTVQLLAWTVDQSREIGLRWGRTVCGSDHTTLLWQHNSFVQYDNLFVNEVLFLITAATVAPGKLLWLYSKPHRVSVTFAGRSNSESCRTQKYCALICHNQTFTVDFIVLRGNLSPAHTFKINAKVKTREYKL